MKEIYLQILDVDSGKTFRHKLYNLYISYQEITQLIESSNPEININNIVIYYYVKTKWLILLQQANIDLQHIQHAKEADQVFRIKYHYIYLFNQPQEKRLRQDIINMTEKIDQVQELYQNLKEKYKQEALDINILWGSPLCAGDKIKRNSKQIQYIKTSKDKDVQLLTNQVKYAPYINAVTTALQTCDKKKVHLQLNHLNQKSFSQKNIFTVVYMIAHFEIEEVVTEKTREYRKRQKDYKDKKTKDGYKKQVHRQKTKYKQKQVSKQSISKQKIESQPQLIITKPPQHISEKVVIQDSILPTQKQKELQQYQLPVTPLVNKVQSSQSIEMIIQDSPKQHEEVKLQHYNSFQQSNNLTIHNLQRFHSHSYQNNFESKISKHPNEITDIQEEEDTNDYQQDNQPIQDSFIPKKLSGRKTEDNEDPQDEIYYDYDKRNNKIGYRYYFLGQDINGQLVKIYPKKLSKMIRKNLSKKIQLLILHTSYPFYHLDQLRPLANNIILINSNPLVPQPATIYYIKQLFIRLLEVCNIEDAYDESIKDLQRLRQINTSQNQIQQLQKFDKKQLKFINTINQRYVHGNLHTCCCFHQHSSKCHHQRKKGPSKYAQYHYKYHSSQCDCKEDYLMIHDCDQKKSTMIDHYRVLHKKYYDNKFYYCCCQGYHLQFYQRQFQNYQLLQITSRDEEKDPHSLLFKFKYEKSLRNKEDNFIEVYQGKVFGDFNRELINAFKYIQENPLLGNTKLLVNLLSQFTKELNTYNLEGIKRLNKNEIYMLCNLYGEKRTGRKTIATYFANLLLIKKLYKRIVIQVFTQVQNLKNIIQNALINSQGRPFFILIHQDKCIKQQKMALKITQQTFGQAISAIIITELKVQASTQLQMYYTEPIPFNNDNCQHYVKKYKHLKYQGKNNVKILFNLYSRGKTQDNSLRIYPCSINQFQILNMVLKTNFTNYKTFISALQRLNQKYIQYYIFIISIVKFTNNPFSNSVKYQNIEMIKDSLKHILLNKQLFYNKYDESLRKEKEKPEKGQKDILTFKNIEEYKEELINIDRINENYYMVFGVLAAKIQIKNIDILKMFINYSTVIPNELFQNSKFDIKRRANYLRQKKEPFLNQIYQATTINPLSYINRYFKKQLQEIFFQYTINKEETQDNHQLQCFIKRHCQLFQSKRSFSRKISHQTSQPKRERKMDLHSSLDLSISHRQQHRVSHDFIQHEQQQTDIPNIHHLGSIIQGGLQYVRTIVCNHFIYNRLNQSQKIQLIKYSMFLINNCIILLKNKSFYSLQHTYDISFNQQSNESYINKLYNSSHCIESPKMKSRKSQDYYDKIPFSYNKTYSSTSHQMLNSNRQFMIDQSSAKQTKENIQDDKNTKSDEFLSRQLYRLSSYKGILFLLSQLERRCQQIAAQPIVRIKICIQLLAIQIRLQLLQLNKDDAKINCVNKDRYVERISQIINQKNYNINVLYKIIREEINNRLTDIEELGIIKSHIMVALSLSASRYGRYKIVKANQMIEEIKIFLHQWAQIPLYKRQSQQDESKQRIKAQFTNMKTMPSQYRFMRKISQNQHVYILIIQSFTSQKFWLSEPSYNEELQFYQNLLSIYHKFKFKNTKTKLDYYKKLQNIKLQVQQLNNKKKISSYSTYIHNFIKNFLKNIQTQFKKLRSFFFAILNAEDSKNYVKISLFQKVENVLKSNKNQSQFFVINKKLNMNNANILINNFGCKFLCISTLSQENNQTSHIFVESEEGKSEVENKQKLAEVISSISSSAIFICLAKKKMLAESIINLNYKKKAIVYFDFDRSKFQIQKDLNNNSSLKMFEKMIMTETIKCLIETIINLDHNGQFLYLSKAFYQIKHSLSFILRNAKKQKIITLDNKQFKSCIFLQNQYEQEQPLPKIRPPIELEQAEQINIKQIQSIEKINKKLTNNMQKNIDKIEQIKLDQFNNNIHNFINFFHFYFKDRYGYKYIFNINLHQWKADIRNNNIVKKFLERLVADKITQFMFSKEKGVVMMYFQLGDSYDQFNKALINCDKQMKQILKNLNESQDSNGQRIMHKFTCLSNLTKRKVPHGFFYIFQKINQRFKETLR